MHLSSCIVALTIYPLTGDPPSWKGGWKETLTELEPRTSTDDDGGSGTVTLPKNTGKKAKRLKRKLKLQMMNEKR
jgi:hypothetical protein